LQQAITRQGNIGAIATIPYPGLVATVIAVLSLPAFILIAQTDRATIRIRVTPLDRSAA
jgi:hypothetical protein